MYRTPHTACKKGKRVLVILRDGTRIEDHFEERTDRWIKLRVKGKIMKESIRSFSIMRK